MELDYQFMTGAEVVAYFANEDPADIAYAWNAMHYHQGQAQYVLLFSECNDLTDLESVIGGDWRWQTPADYDRLRYDVAKAKGEINHGG